MFDSVQFLQEIILRGGTDLREEDAVSSAARGVLCFDDLPITRLFLELALPRSSAAEL